MTFVIDEKGKEVIHKNDKFEEGTSEKKEVYDDLTGE